MRVFLDVVKPEHAAGHRRQARQRAFEQTCIRQCPWRRGGTRRDVVLGQFLKHDPAFAAQAHQCFVDHDLAQPAPERRLAAELADAFEQAQHRVVHGFARTVGIAEHAQRERVRRSLERAVDLFERADIAASRAGKNGIGNVDLEGGGAHRMLRCACLRFGRTPIHCAADRS